MDMLIIVAALGLGGAVAALLMGGYAVTHAGHGGAAQIPDEIEELPGRLKVLEAQVASLEERMTAAEAKLAPAPEPPKKPSKPWEDFVADYNLLAATIDGPEHGQDACDKFFERYGLKGLICLDPAAEHEGKPAPKFVEVGAAAKSTYWGLDYDHDGQHFAIVPNPTKGYTKDLHENGGMKETFASDYEDKDADHLQVKLPALFSLENGHWLISQPGIVKLLKEA